MDQKREILEKAITMFSSAGYENVTMKEIAVALNIAPAEIYNYFTGKEDILEAIYAVYNEVLTLERLPPEGYIPILESGSPEDIFNIFNFPLPEPSQLYFCVVRLVLSRKDSDERAKAAYLKTSWVKGLKYVREVLTKGVEIGRIDMRYEEIETFAHLVYSIREYSANMATLIPEQATWRKIETDMMKQFSKMITLKSAPSSECASETESESAIREAIDCESSAVGKYYHYLAVLRRMGQSPRVCLVDEIIENSLDELDTLHSLLSKGADAPDAKTIIRSVASNEEVKRRVAERLAAVTTGEVSDAFAEIAELAQQHERICLGNLTQGEFVK